MSIHIPATQFADIGLSRNGLESYLAESRYWADGEARKRYRYELSPSAYVVTRRQQETLDRLARTTYASVKALNNRLCDIGRQKSPATHEEGLLLRLANVSTRSLLRPADGERGIPPILKIDLVQRDDGEFGIAEVDTYNPRGLGFVALLEGTLGAEHGFRRYPGLAGIARVLKGRLRHPGDEWHLLVSDFERFYETSFRLFADAMVPHGADVRVLTPHEFGCAGFGPLDQANLVIIPDTLDAHPEVRDYLLKLYRAGGVQTLFPPVAYLGSKAFLPILRAHPGMAEFIPPTTLVGKRFRRPEEHVDFTTPLVLKATVSSGLKKVVFSDLDTEFDAMFATASALRNPSWILQEQVKQVPYPVVVFDENGERVMRDYYLRVTAYIAEDGIVDVEVTGRPDRKVHGAPDCIMLPSILA